ncbi:Zinc finger protein jing, partial [Stegodyphus mimosarum]
MHNDSDIVSKCLERLNGTLPSATIEPFLKSSLSQKFNGYNFERETFAARIGRSPSTDSIGGSNFSSDQGSVDSCNYSNHGSDSNSGSAPCSPEEPDRFSRAGTPQPMPPIPPSLQDDSQSEEDQSCQIGHHELEVKDNMCTESRTAVDDFCGGNERVHFSQQKCSDKTKNRTDPVTSPKEMKLFYLEQSSCSVPNSKYEPFQRAKSLSYVPSHEQTSDGSSSNSSNKTLGHSKTSVHSELAFPFVKQNSSQLNFPSCNSANQSNCSSTEIQQCNWVDCKTCVEGNAELVEHIRSQHVQTQMNKESFVCLWVGCKVYNRASCSLSWL